MFDLFRIGRVAAAVVRPDGIPYADLNALRSMHACTFWAHPHFSFAAVTRFSAAATWGELLKLKVSLACCKEAPKLN